jgi:Zn-dependent protease
VPPVACGAFAAAEVLYALGDPLSFVVLVMSFVFAVTLHGWVQSLLSARLGRATTPARRRPDPRRHVDPFGAIAAAVAGIGWARPVELAGRPSRRVLVLVLLSGAAANVLVGVAALVAFRVLGGRLAAVSTVLLQGGVTGTDLASRVLLLFGLMNVFVAALSLVPLPPLDGGRLLFAFAPRTSGWQRAEYYLVEQNLGVAVLLALLLLPLGGPQALLPTILDTAVAPVVEVVTGG